MIASFARRCVLAAVAAVFALNGAGCFPSRESAYSDVRGSRLHSYALWRGEAELANALPRAAGNLSIEDSVRLALAYSPTLQSIVQEQEKARGQVWTALSDALPAVDFAADYTRLDQVSTVNFGGSSVQVGSRDNWSYQVNVTQPLFRGSLSYALTGARLFQCLTDEKVRQAVQDVVFQVAVAYYDAVLAQHLYQVQVEALQFAEANLRDVSVRQEAGVAIPFDVLRARVEVSNVQADMIQQRNTMNRARTALFKGMGVSQKSDVTLTGELAYNPTTPDLEEAVRTAYMNRPELYQGEFDLRFQRAALQVLRSKYLPELEAWGTQLWAEPNPHDSSDLGWGRRWTAGLRLRWTLFDGLLREGNIIQQKAVLRQSQIRLADTEQAVVQQVANAMLDLADADELVRSQQLNLERANEALRLVTIGAQEGVNTELEVLDARSALTRARGLYYTALHSHVVACLTLQQAIGMMAPPTGQGTVPKEGPRTGVIEQFLSKAVPGEALPEQAPTQSGEGGAAGSQPRPTEATD